MDRHLNVFLPYERSPHHEDQLTRAATLQQQSEGLALCTWPAELKPQAEALYRTDRAQRLINLVTGNPEAWRARPNVHLAFRNAPVKHDDGKSSCRRPSGADLTGATLELANLGYVTLDHADLTGAVSKPRTSPTCSSPAPGGRRAPTETGDSGVSPGEVMQVGSNGCVTT